jgi:hypothetical protein
MKLIHTIDTTNKTIKVEESVNLAEFIRQLEGLLSEGEWGEYTLEVSERIVYQYLNYPITDPLKPIYPPYDPTYKDPYKVTCNMDSPHTKV